MIVERWTLQIKPDKYDEALKLVKEGRDDVWSSFTRSSKVYSSNIGPRNTIVIENEFNDLADRQTLLGKTIETEKWDPWVARWRKVTLGPGVNEIWNVE